MEIETPTLSPDEREQVLQTVEMFEVIVQANPRDFESLAILKDAYRRLGRATDARRVSRMLADAHIEMAQFSSAVIELEEMLATEPDNPELIAMLGDIEERMHRSGQSGEAPAPAMEFGAAVSESGSLMATTETAAMQGARAAVSTTATLDDYLSKDGDEPFARFLIQTRIAPEEIVLAALERVQKRNGNLAAGALAESLLEQVATRGEYEMEALLSSVIDRTKFAYIPLEVYDVDRQVVKMLPDRLTLGRLLVPFDVMSRTLMVATVNPFDAGAKSAAQQLVDYHIQWHLASPLAVAKLLRDTYRLDSVPTTLPVLNFSMHGDTPEPPEPAAAAAPAPAAPVPAGGPDTSHFRIVP